MYRSSCDPKESELHASLIALQEVKMLAKAMGFTWVCFAKLGALQVQACLGFQANDMGHGCACGCSMVDMIGF